jgi:hypothetical protein
MATKYSVTRGAEVYRGEYESPDYSFEIVPDDGVDDLIAEPDEDLDRRIPELLRFAETEDELRHPDGKREFVIRRGEGPFDDDPWKPQITWTNKNGDGGGLHTPVWKLEKPLPVDLCFHVEFQIEEADVVLQCSDLEVLAGEQRSGYFSCDDFAALRDHADKEGFVKGKLVLKPSRALALSHTQVRQYYDAEITSPPVRYKVSVPGPNQ